MATKKKPAAKANKTVKAIKDPLTKSQLLSTLAENTELSKKEVTAVVDELTALIEGHLRKNGAGVFTLPGLLKMTVVRKPATKEKRNVPNPFKPGELMTVKAKPARNIVKIKPLKAVKEMAL